MSSAEQNLPLPSLHRFAPSSQYLVEPELFGVGGLEDPLLDDRNSAPRELSRDPTAWIWLAGATERNSPTTSPPELDDTVIGVDRVASLVDDMR